jgi:Integrator complex subunit 14
MPLRLPYQLNVVCIAGSTDPALAVTEPHYRRLIAKGSPAGQFYVPDGVLCERSVRQMFSTIGERHYATFTGTLRCGNLRCPIFAFPAPEDYDRYNDTKFCSENLEHVKYSLRILIKMLGNCQLCILLIADPNAVTE